MKKIVFVFVLVLCLGCNSKEQALIGKWKETEQRYGGNSGEKVSVEKITNGKTYTFGKDHKLVVVADGESYEGVYEIAQSGQDDILHTITASAKSGRPFDQYFRMQLADSAATKKLSLIPVHPGNELMYSAGRVNVYVKEE